MSKYVRSQPSISRTSDNNSDDQWLQNFKDQLEKSSVQSRKVDQSIYEQINSIMNGTKSKYPSVEAAVEDMKQRAGFTDYIEGLKKKSNEKKNTKTASTPDQNAVIEKKVEIEPIVVKRCPQIKNTIENYIRDTKGNLSIPAIIDKIKSIHHNDISEASDWEDDELLKMVSQLNLQAKRDNPATYQNYHHLGEQDHGVDDIDPSNSDMFASLMPTKGF